MKNTECKEKNCDGTVDKGSPIALRTGCVGVATAYPCKKCGALYWENGRKVFNRPGHRAFFEVGHIVHKDKNGVEQSRF